MTEPAHSAANAASRSPAAPPPPAASKENRRHSIAAKIVFLVFLCTISTALVISAIAVQSTYHDLDRSVRQGLPAALERSHESLLVWLGEGTTALRELASHELSRGRTRGARALLQDFVADSIHFDGAALVSARGAVLASTPALGDGTPEADFAGALRPNGGDGQQLTIAGADGALLAVPIEPGDATTSFLVGRLDRSLLDELLRDEHHEIPASLVLVDAQGRVLASARSTTAPPPDLGVSLARLREEPAGAVHEYANAEGAHALGAALPLHDESDTGWALIAEAPFSSAFAALIDLITRIFVVDLLICIVFIAAAYRITTRMLRPIEDLSEGARLASAGDFRQAIADPGTHDEIGRLTRVFNEMMDKLHDSQSDLQDANHELKSRNEELQRANEVLSQLSITDGLTKLHNHRYFQDSLTREIKRQSRTGKPLSVLLVDLDDFKALNDRLGHASGDELLMRVASIMDATVRESDLLARYGGEEFVVLATDTDLEGAVALAEKIRMAVEQAPHIVNESLRPVRITVSIGVAQYAGNRRRFFESADRALYRAKDQGKNCVVAADEEQVLD
jgi:diguanylate cyclase (GGDEF)-like protein